MGCCAGDPDVVKFQHGEILPIEVVHARETPVASEPTVAEQVIARGKRIASARDSLAHNLLFYIDAIGGGL